MRWFRRRDNAKQPGASASGTYPLLMSPSRSQLLEVEDRVCDLEERLELLERVLTKAGIVRRQEAGCWLRFEGKDVFVSDEAGPEEFEG